MGAHILGKHSASQEMQMPSLIRTSSQIRCIQEMHSTDTATLLFAFILTVFMSNLQATLTPYEKASLSHGKGGLWVLQLVSRLKAWCPFDPTSMRPAQTLFQPLGKAKMSFLPYALNYTHGNQEQHYQTQGRCTQVVSERRSV